MYPKLTKDAVPTLFPNCPKNLSKPESIKRRPLRPEYTARKKAKLNKSLENSCNKHECKIVLLIILHNYCNTYIYLL